MSPLNECKAVRDSLKGHAGFAVWITLCCRAKSCGEVIKQLLCVPKPDTANKRQLVGQIILFT